MREPDWVTDIGVLMWRISKKHNVQGSVKVVCEKRGGRMATLRQRSSLSQDYGGELGIEPVSTPTSSGPQPWRRTFENVVWVAAACFAVYYGDSKHQLFHVVFYDPRIRRSTSFHSLFSTTVFCNLATCRCWSTKLFVEETTRYTFSRTRIPHMQSTMEMWNIHSSLSLKTCWFMNRFEITKLSFENWGSEVVFLDSWLQIAFQIGLGLLSCKYSNLRIPGCLATSHNQNWGEVGVGCTCCNTYCHSHRLGSLSLVRPKVLSWSLEPEVRHVRILLQEATNLWGIEALIWCEAHVCNQCTYSWRGRS